MVGYRKGAIMSHFERRKSIGANIRYAIQDRQLGTAHALILAVPKGLVEDDFLVVFRGQPDRSAAGRRPAETQEGHAIVVTSSPRCLEVRGGRAWKGSIVSSIVEKPEQQDQQHHLHGIVRFTTSIFRPDR